MMKKYPLLTFTIGENAISVYDFMHDGNNWHAIEEKIECRFMYKGHMYKYYAFTNDEIVKRVRHLRSSTLIMLETEYSSEEMEEYVEKVIDDVYGYKPSFIDIDFVERLDFDELYDIRYDITRYLQYVDKISKYVKINHYGETKPYGGMDDEPKWNTSITIDGNIIEK